MKSRNALITLAAVAGVGLGSFGLTSALSGDQPVSPTVDTTEVDAPGDEVDDGIDHQFEGEEVGENGDGIPGPNEAAEADESESDDDDNQVEEESEGDALTGAELEQASAAALAHTGEGTVVEAEAEDGGFEVEVVLDDGSEVDVLLDADFNVTGQEIEGADDD